MKILLLLFLVHSSCGRWGGPDHVRYDRKYLTVLDRHDTNDVALASDGSGELGPVPVSWFDQCMDHFDSTDPSPCQNTYQQRYWWSDEFVQNGDPNAPIFFHVGGESPEDMNYGVGTWSNYWKKYAKEHNGYALNAEHRYYGYSFPTPYTNRSATLMSRYFTSRQAIADYVNLLRTIKKTKGLTGKVITIGGSYPGALAAWTRLLAPNDINAALSSSAPLQYQAEFPEYKYTASKAIKESNPKCFEKVQATFDCLESLVNGNSCSGTQVSLSNIPAVWGQCWFSGLSQSNAGDLVDWVDVWSKNNPATGNVDNCAALLKQNSGDLMTDYGNFLLETKAVKEACSLSSDEETSTENDSRRRRRRSVTSLRRDKRRSRNKKKDDSASESVTNDSWEWQACNEFGNIMISDPVNHMLGRKLQTFSTEMDCGSTYPDVNWTKELIEKNVAKTNAFYGGKKYNGTCTIFVNGGWDPWHTEGIYLEEDFVPGNKFVFIQKGEHYEDLLGTSIYGSPWADGETKKAHKKIRKYVKELLNDPKC